MFKLTFLDNLLEDVFERILGNHIWWCIPEAVLKAGPCCITRIILLEFRNENVVTVFKKKPRVGG
jgi:hypothetical protein